MSANKPSIVIAYRQGKRAADRDFGRCSAEARKGYSVYWVRDSDYAWDPEKYDNLLAEAWREGYRDQWSIRNRRPRKKDVPMPMFRTPRKVNRS